MFCLAWATFALLGVVMASSGDYSCPDTYSLNEVDKTCLKVYDDHPRTHPEAREVCEGKNMGDLAQPRTIQSNKVIAGQLAKRKRYWVGMVKKDDDVMYVRGSSLTFDAPWARGEPNNHSGNEECVEMIGNKRGSWNDKRCSRKRPFVCQIKATKRPSFYDQVSCDFENVKQCNYKLRGWKVVTNDTNRLDHTLKTPKGHFITPVIPYVYLFTYLKPDILLPISVCASMYYQGKKASINYKTADYGRQYKIDKPKVPGPQWNKISWTLPPLGTRMRIWFVVSSYNRTVLSIDDITFKKGPCSP